MMKERLRNEILQKLDKNISNQVAPILDIVLQKYEVTESKNDLVLHEDINNSLLSKYIATLRLEGKSENTIKQYYDAVNLLLVSLNKNIDKITTNDIRYHLAMYQRTRKISKKTLDNKRRYLSTFFSWLTQEEYIIKNPMLRIKRIKQDEIIKKPFSDTDIEKIRQCTKNKKEVALVEFMLSTGCRVSEVVNLNKEDIDMAKRECIVKGKGRKERKVYLSEKCMFYLGDYLGGSKNGALFTNAYGNRITKTNIESLMRRWSKKIGVKVYPHRFRRTFATSMLHKGMALHHVQRLLGHSSPDTTLIYCMIEDEQVKFEHQKIA